MAVLVRLFSPDNESVLAHSTSDCYYSGPGVRSPAFIALNLLFEPFILAFSFLSAFTPSVHGNFPVSVSFYPPSLFFSSFIPLFPLPLSFLPSISLFLHHLSFPPSPLLPPFLPPPPIPIPLPPLPKPQSIKQHSKTKKKCV